MTHLAYTRKLIYMFSFFLSLSSCAIKNPSSIKVPFKEDFETRNKPKKKFIGIQAVKENRAVVVKNSTFKQSKNDILNPFGNSIKLTVRANDYFFKSDTIGKRTRTELVLFARHPENTTYYYSWKFFIPDNEKFMEKDSKDAYHHLAQIFPVGKEKICVPDRQIMGLTYFHSIESTKYRKIKFLFQYQNLDECENAKTIKKRLEIEKAVKKGEWTEIIMKIKWSTDPKKGYIEFWFNRIPLKIMKRNKWVDDGFLNMNNTKPTRYYLANMYKSKETMKGVSNAIKIGHYRKKYTTNSTMYIDDIMITKEMPLLWNQTNFDSKDCDEQEILVKKLKAMEHKFAEGYLFVFSKGNKEIVSYKSRDRKINLKNIKELIFGQSYEVTVTPVFKNNKFGKASSKCKIKINKN